MGIGVVGMNNYWGEDTRVIPGFSDDSSVFRSEVSVILAGIREELDDHRQAINENTNEVESHFESMSEIARRLDSLSERLDQISRVISLPETREHMFKVSPLTPKEKVVFSALYAGTEDDPEMTYQRLASRLGMADDLVAAYITNLMEKGVLVKKRYVGSTVRVSLDHRFREKQAKGNLVRLDHPLTAWL